MSEISKSYNFEKFDPSKEKNDQIKRRVYIIDQVKGRVSKIDQLQCIRIAVDRFFKLKSSFSIDFSNAHFYLIDS